MSRIAYVNGQYRDMRDANVNIEDRGYQFSDGVYEVCEIRGGKVVDMPRHLTRLQRSLRELRIDMPMPRASLEIVIHETVRRMINTLVVDMLEQTRANIQTHRPESLDDVRRCPPLAAFSAEMLTQHRELKRFLFQNLYRHYKVVRMSEKAQRLLRELFVAFSGEPRLMPPEHLARADQDPHRAVCDYIAGMTDRYAIREHRRIYDIEELA